MLYCINIGASFMSKKNSENRSVAVQTAVMTPAHTLILILKILLVFSCAGNIYYFLRTGAVTDIVFNAVFAVILICSAVFHNRKTGVYLLSAYLILELAYNFMIFIAAAVQGLWTSAATERLIGYTLFTALMIFLLHRYYRDRINYLK